MRAVILSVLFLASVAMANKKHKEIKNQMNECMKELGVKKTDKGRYDMKDAEEKCFSKCFQIKTKVIDENGKLLEENIPEESRQLWKDCDKKANETDVCKKARQLSKCIHGKFNHTGMFQNMKECIKDLGIQTDDKGKPDTKDAEKKCFAKCVAQKMKIMDDNGKLIEKNAPTFILPTLKECHETVKETDVCKRANEIATCTRDKFKKHMKNKKNKN